MPVDASYDTQNYRAQGGALDVINGELRIGPNGSLTANGTHPALTDNSGGTVQTSISAITAGATYAQADIVALRDAVASLRSALHGAGIVA